MSPKLTEEQVKILNTLPVLPLRDVVVYPHMVIPLFVGRLKSIRAIEAAMADSKQIFLSAQREASKDDPDTKDLYEVGTVATILQLLKLPDNTVKVLVEGNHRGHIKSFISIDPYLLADMEVLSDEGDTTDEREAEILIRSLLTEFEQYVKLNKKIPPEVITSLSGIDSPGRLADTIVAHMSVKVDAKQNVLQAVNVVQRLELVLSLLQKEVELLQVEKKVQGRVKGQMEESQRVYYLNEKLKAIQKELGQLGDGGGSDFDVLAKKIEKAGMSEEAKAKAKAELDKLRMMPPMSAEATVTRNYLDTLLDVPWKAKSKLNQDLAKATGILNGDHYGLEKVKERIIEYLAVQQRVKKLKGPILCLVGPPGVGKTSLGQSIANATGREFIRVSLGGVRDEAEIRGHRRTYIGSLPGKIIQKLIKAKVRNPLFMLDEVDKMAADFRGDPASALLEVLDPEQNFAFNDHYLEVDYDLSDVMFIATANSLDIPPPLLDRMEVIRLSGYTEDEKLHIAMDYLIPKQMERNGLKKSEIRITESAVREIIRHYTREAGVRNLEREISRICRKVVKEILVKKKRTKTKTTKPHCRMIIARNAEKYLGVKHYRYGLADEKDAVGQVTGLAWTEVGGELLKIETVVMPGKGADPKYTGSLGDVMKESITAAVTVVRTRSEMNGIEDDFWQKHGIHFHVPEGATPKDGPSAGIGMCTALVSAVTRIPVRADVAMTGEITLRGEVLPIGGLKEKLLAALRGGVKTVIIPDENKKDLKEIPKNITQELKIIPVRWIDQVLDIALIRSPEPLSKPDIPSELLMGASSRRRKKTDRPSTH